MEDKEILDMLLCDTIQSMKQEGAVDDYFLSLYSFKDHTRDPFTLDVLTSFCADARDAFKILIQLLNEPVLNYKLVEEYIFKVKGSALSVGAPRLAQAITNLQLPFQSGASKEECLKALNQAEQEYNSLEDRFRVCIELERKIISGVRGWESSKEKTEFDGARNSDATVDSSKEADEKAKAKGKAKIV
ncbi:hypothetical protein RIF29_42391 [Crotalaria pallida]|uniref:Histidine-containing phosphotransfer protein n=1 Tax=Crotalaria pallida TaxID=3830 RepID=A0AAN9E9R3_CROPI